MSEPKVYVSLNIDEAMALLDNRADDLNFYVEGLKDDTHQFNQKLVEEVQDEDMEAIKIGLEKIRDLSFDAKDLLESIERAIEKVNNVSE